MIYIGIDPGASGAIAFVEGNKQGVIDMPLVSDGYLKKKISLESVVSVLHEMTAGKPCTVALEEQGVQGGQTSRVAAFSMGINYGLLVKAVSQFCSENKHPLVTVRPQQWKKTLGLIAPKGTSKAEKKQLTVGFISNIFPNAQIRGKNGGIKDGRADALAIAEYARRKY